MWFDFNKQKAKHNIWDKVFMCREEHHSITPITICWVYLSNDSWNIVDFIRATTYSYDCVHTDSPWWRIYVVEKDIYLSKIPLLHKKIKKKEESLLSMKKEISDLKE